MPAGEADAALRRALGTTSGRLKAGVVASLGVRRDAAAVPEIIPLLKDADGFIVEAAIRSLGRIGTPECIDALTNAVSQPGLPFAVMCALGDGISFAAETALKVGNTGIRYDSMMLMRRKVCRFMSVPRDCAVRFWRVRPRMGYPC